MTLPDFTLRRNPRARRILLKVIPRQGLVVVLPPWADAGDARRAVAERADWIRSALARLAAAGRLDPLPQHPPERLLLPAIGFDAAIRVLPRRGARPRLTAAAGRIFLCSDPELPDVGGVLVALLRRHVLRLGKELLPGRLRELSLVCGLPFAAAHIRAQRGRWGSCTARGDIQLNCKLLFLPPELVDHVCIHELCHTRHLNHGPAFHALLQRLSPRAPELERRLRHCGGLVPEWMERT